jgi:hypothetical protein
MSKLRCHISISADGFVSGPNQSEENPLGEGGERQHDWAVSLAAWRESHDKQGGEVNESTPIMEETFESVGAGVLGRNMFGLVGGGAPGRTRAPHRSVLLGDGARLFDNLEGAGIEVEQVRRSRRPASRTSSTG